MTHFNWRWILMDNGNKFRAVTIEDTLNKIEYTTTFEAKVDKFVWHNEAKNDHNYTFNWRWIERDSEVYRVVTLEEKTLYDE